MLLTLSKKKRITISGCLINSNTRIIYHHRKVVCNVQGFRLSYLCFLWCAQHFD